MYPIAVLGLGPAEILLILLVVLVVFGAAKLPKIGTGLGEAMRNFKKGFSGEDDQDSSGPPPEKKS